MTDPSISPTTLSTRFTSNFVTMPYCNPKAVGEVQRLELDMVIPAAEIMSPTVESPVAVDLEERPPEGSQDVRAVSHSS